MLAIGDGMITDIAGAAVAGLDALPSPTASIGRRCTARTSRVRERVELRRLYAEHSLWPVAAIGELRA